MLSRGMSENKTKMRQRGLTKWKRKAQKTFAVKGVAVKVMKQNENFDEQFGIKTTNLQSTDCMSFDYELDTKRLTL
jgi:hypothetical protein